MKFVQQRDQTMCVSVQLANDAFIRVIYVKIPTTLKNIGDKMLNQNIKKEKKGKLKAIV